MNGSGKTSDQKVPKVSPSSPTDNGCSKTSAMTKGEMEEYCITSTIQ